jgi:PDZ domain-containing protein
MAMHAKIRPVILFAALLAGCASNPFELYYQGAPDGRTLPEYDADYTILGGQIPVDSVVDVPTLQSDTDKLLEEGFVPIGQSQFFAPDRTIAPEQLSAQARKIGAHTVLIYSTYRDTITDFQPPPPDASTALANGTSIEHGPPALGQPIENQIYTTMRSNFTAVYFIKTSLQAGIYAVPITDAERRQLTAGRGVKVRAVVQDSPAATAGVQKGDYLVTVGGEAISGVADWKAALMQYAGQDMALGLVRDGYDLAIMVHDNTKGVDTRSNNP